MPLTRISLESTTVDYLGPWLARVGLSTAVDGTNPAIGGQVVRVMEAFRYAVADPSDVTDADLLAVPDSQLERFRLHVLWYAALLVQFRLGGSGGATLSYTAGNRSRTFKDPTADLDAVLKQIMAMLAREGGPVTQVTGAASGVMTGGRDRGAGGLRGNRCWPEAYDPCGYPERLA